MGYVAAPSAAARRLGFNTESKLHPLCSPTSAVMVAAHGGEKTDGGHDVSGTTSCCGRRGMMLAMWLGIGSARRSRRAKGAQVADAAGAAFLSAAKQGSVSAFASALASYADMDKITLFALGRYQNQLTPVAAPS
jgi:hypothetical protein